MTRLARIVAPGLPHLVTQRGNRREPIFFEPGDQQLYIDILADRARKADVAVWAYCLWTNATHSP
jgi:putative transposase